MKLNIKGIRKNNLHIEELSLPLNEIILLTGPSGSGKSTLAREILFKEGQRLYLEGLGLETGLDVEMGLEEVPLQSIKGLPPTLYLDQRPEKTRGSTTVGEFVRLTPLVRLLFVLKGNPRCPRCGIKIPVLPLAAIRDRIVNMPDGTRLMVTTPIPKRLHGAPVGDVLRWILKQGFVRILVHGEGVLVEDALDAPFDLDVSTTKIVIDRLVVRDGIGPRLDEAIRTVESLGTRVIWFEPPNGPTTKTEGTRGLLFSIDNTCPRCLTTYPKLNTRLFSRRNEMGQCPACKGAGCPECLHSGLSPFSRAIELGGLNFLQVQGQNIKTLHAQFLGMSTELADPPPQVLSSILSRIDALLAMGLGHLELGRPLRKISRGEFQRLRLVRTIYRGLTGTLVILDEPTTGLHPKDYGYLKGLIQDLKAIGNTVLVVEHDPRIRKLVDWIIQLGPGGGSDGGRIVYNGPVDGAPVPDDESLGGDRPLFSPLPPWGSLQIDDRVTIPLGGLMVITGISGSGKTRYLLETLKGALSKHGLSVSHVDQAPLRGNKWAIIATYAGVFTPIRELFSQTKEARLKGLSPGTFSLSKGGGRCPLCKGTGRRELDLSPLGAIELVCDACGGLRYREEPLACKLKGKNIAEVLALTIKEAMAFFSRIPRIRRSLEALASTGLEYLTLGQEISSLSGGEAMRLRLATAFPQTRDPGDALRGRALLLDEPSAGLSPKDLLNLLRQLRGLQKKGMTVVVADHEESFIGAANLVIEMGPGTGPQGGTITALDERAPCPKK